MAGYLSKEFSGLGSEAPLFTDHYQAVRKALLTMRPQWRNIGLALGIPVFKLNEFGGSFEKRTDQMLEVWLNHSYSTPTWRALVTALRDDTVEGGRPVAAEIEAKYLGEEQSVGQELSQDYHSKSGMPVRHSAQHQHSGSGNVQIIAGTGNVTVQLPPPVVHGQPTGVQGVRESDKSHEISRAELDFGEQVGQGFYGTVFKGTWTPKGTRESKEVAIKIVVKIDKDTKREVEVLRKLQHPNTIALYGAVTKPPDYFIVTGVKYLHANNIFHRDLKPSNVLLHKDWTAKICDFGTAKITDFVGEQTLTARVGTEIYMAPEVRDGRYSEKCDVFSYGMILWEMLSCKLPFGGNADGSVPQKIKRGERPELPHDCEQYLAVLIGRCWDGNPENRPTFLEILYVLQERDTSQLRPMVAADSQALGEH